MIKKILIGIDDGKTAENAAKYGFKLAKTLGAQVGMVHMVEPMAMPISTSGADPILGTQMQGLGDGIEELEILNAQETLSDNIITAAIKKYAGKLEVTHFNEYGSTADGIIACSHEFKADMIILGTHHRSGIDRLLMGSVAEDVVRHSDVPVLIVPSKEKD